MSVLTIVDKDLVQLFCAMYKVDGGINYRGGQFTAASHEYQHLVQNAQQSGGPAEDIIRVAKYNLVYMKPGHSQYLQSRNLKEKQKASNELVEQVRVITVNSENDALTIDVQSVSNINYFVTLMKYIDDEFLQRESKITRETALEGSLLLSPD